ncbi:hypothetical protein SAMN06264348_104142 [Oceanospirillum linum]|nr:hypothetical protein SAMN04489856_104116 [Oleiphilus messinensis]SMP21712.1 hypothetical protein SAMN06264348_104142 [Oceanospirillum linum]
MTAGLSGRNRQSKMFQSDQVSDQGIRLIIGYRNGQYTGKLIRQMGHTAFQPVTMVLSDRFRNFFHKTGLVITDQG